ncbi:LuxR family transcriptional regulator [Lentzea sp. NBRC 105346]|uniref:ATP-binding protein n=1 Tax=Lentzea sp. NBRC 105346 TaxID=3032205 RepID=UPI00249FECB3|nr:LuxR C-terminal-related transcriptional regulator [Lentzea sp. NBRC 105346]GLZ28984.1 LuxR family transcriptional regulator [Lentzea sp. NBRC 105346]
MSVCAVCGRDVPGSGIYCSNACRQRAYRGRRDDPGPPSERTVPFAADRFFGRTTDLATVRRLLNDHRTVVITGPTGIGKTRLALEIARQRVARGGQAKLVDLTRVADPVALPSGLLVLDTCEHRAGLATRMAEEHPNLSVLATSTIPLPGFAEHRLAGLPVADRTAAECLGSDAVRLLLDRAPDLEPDDDALREAGRLCTALDGSPFAIELAARMLTVLTPAEIAGDLFALLNQGFRTGAPRHQGLRAAARWGYDLLTDPLRHAVRALALLPGGADAELAGVPEELLRVLVTRSLAVSEMDRYRLFEPVRLLAEEELRSLNEYDAALDRLATLFVHMGQTWFEHVMTPEADLRRWREEVANLAHVAGALTDDRRLLLAAMWGRVSGDGTELLRHALAHSAPDSPYRAPAQETLVYSAAGVGELHVALPTITAALAEERTRDRPVNLARLLDAHVYASHAAGDLLGSITRMHERLDVTARLDDPMARPSSLARIAYLRINLGEYAAAAAAAEEALKGYRENGLPAGHVLINLGVAKLFIHDVDTAEEVFREAMRGFDHVTFTEALEGLAFVELARRQPERAAMLLGAAAQIRESRTLEVDAWWQARLDEAWQAVLDHDDAVRAGGWLSRAEAVALAEGGPVPPARHPALAVLTSGQLDVARLIAEGLTNRQIAQRLDLSARGVEERVRQIKEVLHVRSRAQVAAWAARWVTS